jgi:hypothetical protein
MGKLREAQLPLFTRFRRSAAFARWAALGEREGAQQLPGGLALLRPRPQPGDSPSRERGYNKAGAGGDSWCMFL